MLEKAYLWLSKLGPSDHLDLALLIVTGMGIVFGLRQFKQSVRAERARLLRDLVRDIQTDEQAYGVFYKIEYGNFRYDDAFEESSDERALDKLLTALDLVCELYFKKHLTDSEMDFFNYYIFRVCTDEGVRNYLEFLKRWYSSINVHPGGFDALNRYSERRWPTKPLPI
ncbi:MAG TPA: hypothetical protein VF680_00625 [Allosphingosinicella sp.]|jgi:hypothetical protein